LEKEKKYWAQVHLGLATETYDIEGQVTFKSDKIPALIDIQTALQSFRGEISQIPPMYSAKKVGGKKLCDLARKGITIERQSERVTVFELNLIKYEYPFLEIEVTCSKGTYIRSLAHDLGQFLGCGAHLFALKRTRSGPFCI